MVSGAVLLALVLAGAVVIIDSTRLGWVYGMKLPGGGLSPWGWGMAVIVMPIVFVPVYLVTRARFVRDSRAR